MIEKDYAYEIEPVLSWFDENHIIKPYVYQSLFGQVLGSHLKAIHSGFDTTLKFGLAWVLVSVAFEVSKPVPTDRIITGRTWFSERRGPFFRREILFAGENGETLFSGSTFSVLMNTATRTVFRQTELPFFLPHPLSEFTVEASPIYKTNVQFQKTGERSMYNSCIDGLGHVNNSRYGEFAYDTLTGGELLKMDSLKRFDVYFISEMKNNETLTLLKACEGDRILVRGYNRQKECIAFDSVMTFHGL